MKDRLILATNVNLKKKFRETKSLKKFKSQPKKRKRKIEGNNGIDDQDPAQGIKDIMIDHVRDLFLILIPLIVLMRKETTKPV